MTPASFAAAEGVNGIGESNEAVCISNGEMVVDWCIKNDWLGNHAAPLIGIEEGAGGVVIVKWDRRRDYHTIYIKVYPKRIVVYLLHCTCFLVEEKFIPFNQATEKELDVFLKRRNVIG